MYIVTIRQLITVIIAIALLVSVSVFGATSFLSYRDLPEVHVIQGRCIKIINYKNGDGYSCQDKDVTLRKYRLIIDDEPVKPQQ